MVSVALLENACDSRAGFRVRIEATRESFVGPREKVRNF